jgi:DNA polymerase-3 subunit delta'
MWEGIVGQDRAVGLLKSARERAGHAYLLVGPSGSGVVPAARQFAASLIVDDAVDPRVLNLVQRGIHVDVVEFEPEGTYFLKEQADEVLHEAVRAPVEAARKVLLLHDVDRMNDTAGNKLLKTIEEPPARTVFVLTTSRPDEVLETIRSRCQRIDFDALSADAIAEALVATGLEIGAAQRLAMHASGHLGRAHALAGPFGVVRDAFVDVPERVDGTGSQASAALVEIESAIEAATAATVERHIAETQDHDDELQRRGYEGRVAQARKKRLAERHKRELTRLRRDLLLEGVTAIESVYRDALAEPAPARNAERRPIAVPPVACVNALAACRVARESILVNEKGDLHLLRLFLALPVAGLR